MDRLGDLAHRWRYLVIGIEVVVAIGCGYFGWKVVSPQPEQSGLQVHRAGPSARDASGSLDPAATPAGRAHQTSSTTRAVPAGRFTADGLARLNRDDYELYRRQWQVLQLLMAGVRNYLEHRVAPQLLSR